MRWLAPGRRGLGAALVVAALLAGAAGCSGPPRPNVLLVTMDTTRADHLGCYGSTDIATPVIDSLAAQGTLYEHAYAPAPITLPTHTSIMTGTFPVFHGVRDNNGFYVSPDSTTLAEILLANGWSTAAFVGAFVLDSQTGIDQGFELYDDSYPSGADQGRHPLLLHFYDERPASEVSRAARAWLDDHSGHKPFFMWLHYWDPHQPHRAPEPYRTRYANDPYGAEIAFVDEALGQVLAKLREKGWIDDTYIVLAADHGEGLGEHGESTHALILHDATVRVPLIVRDPTGPQAERVTTPVSTVDIMQTVLDRVGIAAPGECQGRPLPPADVDDAPGRMILTETAYGTMSFGWSFIERLTTSSWVLMAAPTPRLHDRRRDPEQLSDLAPVEGQVVAELQHELHALRQELAQGAAPATGRQVSAAVAQRLAALGYVTSVSGTPDASDLAVDPDLPDPWNMMEVADLINEGKNLLDRRNIPMATAVFERARTLDPGNGEIVRYQILTALSTGQLDQAMAGFERLARISPPSVTTELLHSQYCAAANDPEGAIDHLRRAVELDPRNIASHIVLARALDDLGRAQEAEDAYRAVLDEDPDDTTALNSLAVLAFGAGRTGEAVALLDRCLEVQPFYPPPYLNLAVIHHDTGSLPEALQLVERAISLRQAYAPAWELKAMVLEQTRAPGAREAWSEALRLAPDAEARSRAEAALERLSHGGSTGP